MNENEMCRAVFALSLPLSVQDFLEGYDSLIRYQYNSIIITDQGQMSQYMYS